MENPVTIGRLELLWREGSWCRPGEWVFGRQPCDTGCLIFDVGFFVVSWLRGDHTGVRSVTPIQSVTPEMKGDE